MTRLEQELAALKERVLEMGALAESMVDESWQGVIGGDATKLAHVLASEPRLDRFQVDNDQEAVRLIAKYSPVARDLRFLLMIARITSELERVGDQAVDNCEYAALLCNTPPAARDLSTLASAAAGMLHEALQALRDEDPHQAASVMRLDDGVDALYSDIFQYLLQHGPSDPAGRARSTGEILLARSLERIADHATNMCEEVFYLVEGADIRHQAIGSGPAQD